MADFSEDDLEFQDEYTWTHEKGDNPKKIGHPDQVLLDRDEGYEVLPFINRFMKKHKMVKKESFLKVEDLIKNHLPSNIRSHANITAWLEKNWKTKF